MADGGTQDLHVVIIGGGITGLTIAQGCKKHGIKYTVCEKEPSADHYRLREWGLSLHWAIPHLEKCIPEEMAKRLQEAQVDPHRTPPPKGEISYYDAGSGKEITKIAFPFLRRMSRNKLRRFLTKDVVVQYGKQLKEVTFEGDNKVSAHFEDGTSVTGTNLVGCDGPRSKTREAIFGPEEGAAKSMGLELSNFLVNFKDAEKAKWVMESFEPPMVIGTHPKGYYSWMGAVDIPNPDDPLTWQWQILNSQYSLPNDSGNAVITGLPTLAKLKERAPELCDPFKTAISWIPDDTPYFESAITEWSPRSFDEKGGRISLAGDGAHPMAPHRGQGLNHAICDGANYVEALRAVKAGEKSLADAVKDYSEEMIKRGTDEVKLSHDNASMVHDLEKLLDSPFVKHNVQQKGHGAVEH